MPTGKLIHSTGFKPDATDHILKMKNPFAPVRARMGAAVVAPTGDWEIDDHLVAVFDQLNEESCVANAWTADLMILLALEFGVAPDVLARQFAYWTFRCITSDQGSDAGTFLSSGAQALSTTGICLEKYWPYDPSKTLISPPSAAFYDASENILKAFYALTEAGAALGADIESCIRANHPVPFGAQIGQELDAYQGSGADPNKVFEAPTSVEGGHGLLITGVRSLGGKRQWKIRNSWGPGWGLNGYFWMSDDYQLGDACSDRWTATRMDALVV